MAVANTTVLNLLGKDVSFDFNKQIPLTGNTSINFHRKVSGTVTAIVFSFDLDPQISVDDGDFYTFSELTEFQVLDDHSIVDAAFTGLITDNKDFIDSLSK